VWLAIRNRCWTADQLQIRGLPHPDHCPLCDQEENVQHILNTCVFTHQFWFSILQSDTKQQHNILCRVVEGVLEESTETAKGFNSLCILGAWTLWKQRNACVFDGVAPNLQRTIQTFKDDSLLWQFSRAKDL
jgi:hypothetical protein